MLKFSNHDFPPLPSEATGRRSKRLKRKEDTKAEQASTSHNYATINDLPDELILGILDSLPGIDFDNFHLETLLSLSITNRRFHRLVAKPLYASYNSFFCEPYLFLRTVITSPHLVQLIQDADITYGDFAHCERERYKPTAQDKRIIKQGLKALGIPDWKTWATECNVRLAKLDTLHSAILMHTPNLKSLDVKYGDRYNEKGIRHHKWIEMIKRANLGTPTGPHHSFECLQYLRIQVVNFTLMDLAPVFQTPSLRVLTLIDLDENGEDDLGALTRRIPLRCNDLEELNILNGLVSTSVLGIMLSSARGLKRLRYELELQFDPRDNADDDDEDQDDVLGLVETLACQRPTLESLSFACDERAEIRFRGALNLYRGLQNFPALKHLNCPLNSIADTRQRVSSAPLAQKLPPSLETLAVSLRRNSDEVDLAALGNLEQMAATCSTYTPDLKTVRIWIELLLELPEEYDWAVLMEPLSRNGVDLVIEHEELEDDGFEEVSESVLVPRARFIDVDGLDDLEDEDSSRASDEVSLYSN
jgi:hypothetical protein